MDPEFLIFGLIAVIALSVPIVSFVLSLVAFMRAGRIKSLELRIQQLEFFDISEESVPIASTPYTAAR